MPTWLLVPVENETGASNEILSGKERRHDLGDEGIRKVSCLGDVWIEACDG